MTNTRNDKTRLIAALDTQDAHQAHLWASQLRDTVDGIKLGLEFTYACGLETVSAVASGHSLFLDLKLHDIPNTVAGGLTALRRVHPYLMTIHASGGRAMIERAREALHHLYPQGDQRPRLLAVTVLTSLDDGTLHETGVTGSVEEQVIRLGTLAVSAGADGLVCASSEIRALRRALGQEPILVVPGIRPKGAPCDDQKRIMTPSEAARAGADWIVVGRPITRATDPVAVARSIQHELQSVTASG